MTPDERHTENFARALASRDFARALVAHTALSPLATRDLKYFFAIEALGLSVDDCIKVINSVKITTWEVAATILGTRLDVQI